MEVIKMLEELKVKDIMTKNVITVGPQEDVVFVFEKLMKNKISSIPVMDGDELLGLVTASDLGHNLILDKYELGTTVAEVMVTDVVCVNPEEDLLSAISKMSQYGTDNGIINQLIVMDGKKLSGILSDGDIIRVIR